MPFSCSVVMLPEMLSYAPRILLVEDHEDTRIITAKVLSREGYQVTAVATKSQALAECEKQQFDLLIGEIQLPDGSGLDLMREAAARCNIKGIAYTAYGYEKDVADARAAGFSVHLLKPADMSKFIETVRDVLGETLFSDLPEIHS